MKPITTYSPILYKKKYPPINFYYWIYLNILYMKLILFVFHFFQLFFNKKFTFINCKFLKI